MRPDWDTHFIYGARWSSEMATCPRRSVGAVLVKNHRVISTGHNGAAHGQPHCDSVGCMIIDGHCKTAIHAELNAILHADWKDIGGSTIYIAGAAPCVDCAKIILQAGIYRVVCDSAIEDYAGSGKEGVEMLQQCGVEVKVVKPDTVSNQHKPKSNPVDIFKLFKNWDN